MLLTSIRAPVLDDLKAVDALICQELISEVSLIEEIGRYLIESGGKRLRPLLVLLAARACGYTGTEHVRLATILEFIHTATLLHDDVVDASTLRRGRHTANTLWGNEASVLVGDFLYSRAFQLMVKIPCPRVMEVMANTTNLIAEGEVLQLIHAREKTISEAVYFEVIRRKTAVLFSAGAELTADLSHQPELENTLSQFGLNLGMAFQLIDDVLDYTGLENCMGKHLGDDVQTGKITFPMIYGLQHVDAGEKSAILELLHTQNTEGFTQLLNVFRKTDAFVYTKKIAETYAAKARTLLDNLPCSIYQQALVDLVHFSVERTF